MRSATGSSLFRGYGPPAIVALYACFVAFWAASADWLTTVVVGNQSALPRIGVAKALIFVAVTASVLYLLQRWARLTPTDAPVWRSPRHLAAILLGLAMIVPVADLGIARKHSDQLEWEAQRQLATDAARIAGEMENWLDERKADAEMLMGNTSFARQVADFLYEGTHVRFEPVVDRLDSMLRGDRYRAMLLFNREGNAELLRGAYVGVSPQLVSLVRGGTSAGPLVHYSEANVPYLDWIVPLHDSTGSGKPVATLVMRSDAHRLRQLLEQAFPAAAEGSAVVYRLDGSETRILGESRRFSAPGLLAQSRPGKQGMVSGPDANGTIMLAAYHPVGATDWLVMTLIDQRAVMAPLHRFVMWVTLAALAAMVPLLVAIFYVQRRYRRRTQDALEAARAEKSRLLQAFHDMPFTGIAMFSARTGQPVNVNGFLSQLLGRTESELLECNWRELVHPEDRSADPLRLRGLVTGDVSGSQAELRLFHRDGTPVEVSIHVQCLTDELGRPEYFIASIQDVSERKAYEQTLREREADLNRAQHLARMGSWSLDIRRNILTWSPECHRIFGVPAGEKLTYERFLDCVHIDDRGVVDEAWKRATQGEKYDIEHRIVVNGEEKWIRERADLAFDENGALLGGIGTAQDVTEQRRSEERLRQAAMVFERSGDGIIVTNADRRITMVNPALCRMMGYEESEILGNTPEMFRSGRHGADFYRELWGGLSETGHWRGEVWDRRKSGEIFPALLSISVLRDQGGRITGYVGVFTDISKLKASEAKLAHLAHHDALTGLPNRLLMRTRLEHSVEVGNRRGAGLALLMLDLDGFGEINDSFGHLAGDELLRHAAVRLRRCVRSADTVARFSGDEFCILLEDIDGISEVTNIALKIIEQLASPLRLSNGAEVRVNASIGISLCPQHGRTAEALLQQADSALYRAKDDGQGRLRFYSDEMTEESRARVELQSQLHRAFEAGQLQVYYQPQVEVGTGRIIGAEALLRWHDPERGLIPTGEWIALAEETGMIASIGNWALREVCSQGRRWMDEGLRPITLAVNLSPRQLLHSDICELVESTLQDTGFPARCMEFELTETAIMTHAQEAERIMRRMREIGIQLAIDDFGTGYSSLAHLKRFPLNVLKIDRRFIEGIPDDPSDCELVRAIVAMGQALNLRVLAEGVESERQLVFLAALGCDRYQGFLRSPALTPEEFGRLLRA